MELFEKENNRLIYKDGKNTFTIIREITKDKQENISSFIEALLSVIEQDEKAEKTNEE